MKFKLSIQPLYFIVIVSLFLISSCSHEGQIPEGIIPQDSMIIILTNVHLAESRLMLQGKNATDEKYKSAYMQHVLADFKMDTTRFNRSFVYYTSKPELFSGMYDKVIAEISKRQAEKK